MDLLRAHHKNTDGAARSAMVRRRGIVVIARDTDKDLRGVRKILMVGIRRATQLRIQGLIRLALRETIHSAILMGLQTRTPKTRVEILETTQVLLNLSTMFLTSRAIFTSWTQ
jgi:hypothetical protein